MKLLRDDAAQDAVEFLLTAGAVALVIVGGLFALNELIPDVLGYVCPAVDTANPAAIVGSCLGIT